VKVTVNKRTFIGRVKRFGGRVRKLFKPKVVETKPRRGSVSSLVPPRKPPLIVSVRLPTAEPESPRSRQNPEAPTLLPRRFSLQSLLHPRLPFGSIDSSSRNRLPTIVSDQDENWLSAFDTHSPDVAAADVPRIGHPGAPADRENHEQKAEYQTPGITTVRHGLGIAAPEHISVPNRDTA